MIKHNKMRCPPFYKHSLFVSFWANCTTEDYAPGDPFETCVGQMQLNFFESFDCTNPVFDHAPEVLYGSEIAERLLDWTEDWDFYGENTGKDNYCWSMTRAYFQTAYVDLFADPQYENACKLFVIAEASDMVTTLRGNIRPLAMDIKRIGASEGCEYGNVLVDCGMGLFYDERPWAGRFGVSQGDMELITDWPDHNYCYGEPPACVWHDWCGEEGVISIFPISSLLLPASGDDIVDIRIRAMDNSPNYQGIHGNWIRSENILEQICGRSGQRYAAQWACNFNASVIFIGDNPKDEAAGKWKILNYSGDTKELETSFISRRDDDGSAFLHVLIKAESNGCWLVPSDYPETMEITFKSNEVLPEGISIPQTVKGVAVRWDLCDDPNELPSGLTLARIMQLFNIQFYSWCGEAFYYLKLEVSDDKVTQDALSMNSIPVLYVSSRDHMLGQEGGASILNMLDYAESEAIIDTPMDKLGVPSLYYGKRRGLGFEPTPKNKWYGYDEYIVNGGFEVVEVSAIDSFFNPISELPYAPVQSEADVMLIHGHGVQNHNIILLDQDGNEIVDDSGPYDVPYYHPVAGVKTYPRQENHLRPSYSCFSGNGTLTWSDLWGQILRVVTLTSLRMSQSVTVVWSLKSALISENQIKTGNIHGVMISG
jgi:hypothetical protein